LLVVISVIAILLDIMLPVLSKAKDLARALACEGNLKSCGYAIAICTKRVPGEN